MCGIAGFIDLKKLTPEQKLHEIGYQMGASLHHRGPDDYGVWADEANGVALSHRRLSILDLSPLGHQPMQSMSERYVIVFNGEIYNFKQLRQQLTSLGHNFKGGSDTEVLLAAIEQYGINEAVKKCVGMFAFALWDKQQATLYLCRDRMGEKPLYYGKIGNTFLFASELKALKQHPGLLKHIDSNSVAQLVQSGYVAGPRSILKNIQKLRPGCILSFQPATKAEWIEQPYWSLKEVAEYGQEHPIADQPRQVGDQLLILLTQVIRDQLVADVPVGAFLSGGVDSSTIVAMAQAQSSRPLKTFTIGFDDPQYNEADVARRIATHLKTDHTEMQVTARDALEVIPRLAKLYDEPIADSSQIPTFLVSQLARQQVTVSLSGDGGDELFAGYQRYARGQRLWNLWRKSPAWLRSIGSGSISAMEMVSARFSQGPKATLLAKMSRVIGARATRDFYMNMVSHALGQTLVLNTSAESIGIFPASQFAKVEHFTPQMQYLDAVTYLPDDILVKVDRAGMGVSLESRIPFLDHRVVEFSWQLPMSMKMNDGRTKWILRQLNERYLPQSLFNEKKRGFSIPLASWLRGPLRDWGESLLDESQLNHDGIFDVKAVRQMWQEHHSGQRDWQYVLWGILMFQDWKQEFLSQPSWTPVPITNAA